METSSNSLNILFVCMANYCRSPVAEFLLKKRFNSFHNISSAALIPSPQVGMDPRSIKFLKKTYDDIPLHVPRKITKNLAAESDIIYALDLKILVELNKKFSSVNSNIKLFTLENEKIFLNDPFKFSDIEYENIMKKILYVSSNISIKI